VPCQDPLLRAGDAAVVVTAAWWLVGAEAASGQRTGNPASRWPVVMVPQHRSRKHGLDGITAFFPRLQSLKSQREGQRKQWEYIEK